MVAVACVRRGSARRLVPVVVLGWLAAGSAWGQAEPALQEPVVVALGAGAAAEGDGPRPASRLSLSLTPALPSFDQPAGGAIDVGLQWRQALPNRHAVDITAWRRLQQQPADALTLIQQREPVYGARVEMKIAPRRSGFTTDYKFIGLQLDSGARITLRRKDGRPTIYFRQQF